MEGDGPDGPWRLRARQVVNATWEQRLAFDRQLGLTPPADLLHRLKYRLIARLPAVGILTDDVIAEVTPVLHFGLGWLGFLVGFRFDVRFAWATINTPSTTRDTASASATGSTGAVSITT